MKNPIKKRRKKGDDVSPQPGKKKRHTRGGSGGRGRKRVVGGTEKDLQGD